jgi:hypothetical protein
MAICLNGLNGPRTRSEGLNGLKLLNFQLSQVPGGAGGASHRRQKQDRYEQFRDETI